MKRQALKSKQLGVTLIELMVAITIGLIIISGVLQLYASSTKTQLVQDGVSRLQENARFLFARLSQDLSQTGFVGCFNFDSGRIAYHLAEDAGAGEIYHFDQPVDAINGNGPLGTDTLIFRRASAAAAMPLVNRSEQDEPLWVDPDHGNYGPLEQFQVVMVTDCSRASVFMISNDPNTSDGEIKHEMGIASPEGQSNTENRLDNAYGSGDGEYPKGGSVAYLYAGTSGGSSYSVGDSAAAGAGEGCSAATPEFCALFKNDQELVQGVEDFQVEFGWTNAAGNLRYDEPSLAVDWNAVDRIKITVTLNSVEATPSPQGARLNTKTFVKTIVVRNQFI